MKCLFLETWRKPRLKQLESISLSFSPFLFFSSSSYHSTSSTPLIFVMFIKCILHLSFSAHPLQLTSPPELSPSLSLSFPPPLSLSLSLSLFLSLPFSLPLSFSFSLSLCVCLSLFHRVH